MPRCDVSDDVKSQSSWHDFCASQGLNPFDHPVVLAVSGGVDSMAMAHILHQFWMQSARHHPSGQTKSLRALIIDHGIRPESAIEAALTAERLTALNIPNRVERLTGPAPQKGVQEWAREQRYRALWREACRDQAVIVTAHHAEDQAETLLMRLAKGSGIKGLGGMQNQSERHGITLLRPFLGLSKQVLRDYAVNEGIAFVEDPSNDNPVFERVRWRQAQADYDDLGFSVQNLNRMAGAFSALDQVMSGEIRRLKGKVFDLSPWGQGWIDHAEWQSLPDLAQRLVLAHILGQVSGTAYPPSQESLARLNDWVCDLPSKGRTLGGVELTPKKSGHGRMFIWVYPEAERPWQAKVYSEGHHIIDGRWQVYLPQDSRLEPLGERGFANAKKQMLAKGQDADHLLSQWRALWWDAPARSFWRLPVVRYATKTLNNHPQDHLLALEDGAMIPHVSKVEMNKDERAMNANQAWMRFSGYYET